MNLSSNLMNALGGALPSPAPAPVTGRAVAMRGVSHPVFAALRTHPAAIVAARGGSPLRAGHPGISSRQSLGGGSDAVTSATPDGYATGGVDDGAPTTPTDPGIFPLPTPSPSAFQQALQQRIPQANAQVSIGPAQEKGLTDSQKKALILGLGAAALGVGYLVYQQGRK